MDAKRRCVKVVTAKSLSRLFIKHFNSIYFAYADNK